MNVDDAWKDREREREMKVDDSWKDRWILKG